MKFKIVLHWYITLSTITHIFKSLFLTVFTTNYILIVKFIYKQTVHN